MIPSRFVNEVPLQMKFSDVVRPRTISREDIAPDTLRIESLLAEEEAQYLLNFLEGVRWIPVSITGMQGNYKEGDPIGSWRTSSFVPDFADELWKRLKPLIKTRREFHEYSPVDYDGHRKWQAYGVNPLFRFIRYTDGGLLVPHYDAPYIANDDERTLQSLVIYLDNDERIEGGQTRFLYDPQVHLPVVKRDLRDWKHLAAPADVRVAVAPRAKDALVFDHRILHDSAPVSGEGVKTIIRTDILWRKVR